MTPRRPLLLCVLVAALLPRAAHARRDDVVRLSEVVQRLAEAQRVIVAAERAVAASDEATEEQLAKRLVKGQLKLSESDYEGAAIVFLDLLENHPRSQAAPQAVHFLGRALMALDMQQWAAEMFTRNLANGEPEARRFHQQSVARLLELRHPSREPGFAQQPGLSATPETRARLRAMGVDADHAPPEGVIGASDAERLERWARSFPPNERIPELRYAFGRYLYLAGKHEAARKELDQLGELGPEAAWRIRGAYIAASATLALGEREQALERFGAITKAHPKKPRDRRIVELAWMALGRIHHDEGHGDRAVAAYRRIGRDSPFFPEALYEIAWTLLRAGQYEQAVHALDLLLVYQPDSPIAHEIKQLRGKAKIQQRDYVGAEEEFLGLRREYKQLAEKLQRKLEVEADASGWFASVIGQDMRHFSLASLLPVQAVAMAQALPRAEQGQEIAHDVGALEDELRETRALLARMEEALRADQPARLFTDLGAHAAALDTAERDLLKIQADLVRRAAARAERPILDQYEDRRLELKKRVEQPLGPSGGTMNATIERLQQLSERIHKLELTVAAQRAQLVAAERYYEETRKQQKIDREAFLEQAAELRNAIAAAEDELKDLRNRIARAESVLRFDNPYLPAKAQAVIDYREHLQRMYAAVIKAAPDPESGELWKRAEALEQRVTDVRSALDRTASSRLKVARAIVVEERANLDNYLVELTETQQDTKRLVSDVMAASYHDVVQEVEDLVIRSEVGLLDVAWSMKEVEAQAVQQLERSRNQEIEEIERNLEFGLEALQP